MALSPEEQAAIDAKASAFLSPDAFDAGLAPGGAQVQGPPPPVPAAPAQIGPPAPPPDPEGTIPAITPLPSAKFALPPDVAARAAQQALQLPATGPAPHAPGDSIAFAGGAQGAGGAAGQVPIAAPSPVTSSSTSKTTVAGVPFSAGTLAAQADAQKAAGAFSAEQPGAVKELQAAQNARAEAQGVYTKTAEQNALQAQEMAAKHEAALAPMRADIQGSQAALATKQVDPEHFMHSRSTLQKVGLILGQMIGAFGAGYGHTPNFAAELIKSRVDDDIDAQKANIAKGQKDVENKVGQYNLTAGAYRSQEEKDVAARAMKLSAVGEQIKQYADAEQDPQKRQQLLAVGAENARNAAAESAKLDEMVAGKVSTTTHSSTSSGGMASGTGGLPADRIVRGPDGKMYLAPDAKSAQEHRTIQVASERLKSTLAKMDVLNKEVGVGIPGNDAHTRMGVLAEEAKTDLAALGSKRAKALGVDSKEFASKTVGEPDSFGEWHWNTRSDALRAMAAQNVNDSLQEFQPVGDGQLAIQSGKPIYTNTGVPVVAAPKAGKR